MDTAVKEWSDQRIEITSANPISNISVQTRTTVPELEAEIESARMLLRLPDNWDGEGSAPYSENTLKRAIAFVRMHIERVWEAGINAPAPRISAGPDGSIDVHWKQRAWELLVNVPADETQPAAFYGDDYGAGVIKGTIDTARYSFGLLEWLMK